MNKNASGSNPLSRPTNHKGNSTPKDSGFVVSLKIPDKMTTRYKPNDSGGGSKNHSLEKESKLETRKQPIKRGSKDSFDEIKEFISATGERFYLQVQHKDDIQPQSQKPDEKNLPSSHTKKRLPIFSTHDARETERSLLDDKPYGNVLKKITEQELEDKSDAGGQNNFFLAPEKIRQKKKITGTLIDAVNKIQQKFRRNISQRSIANNQTDENLQIKRKSSRFADLVSRMSNKQKYSTSESEKNPGKKPTPEVSLPGQKTHLEATCKNQKFEKDEEQQKSKARGPQ